MKSAILFLSGALTGALLLWAVFCQEVVVLGSGRLVRINRFTGEARYVFVSGLEMESRQKAEEAKAAAAENTAPPQADPSKTEWRELTAEETAKLDLKWRYAGGPVRLSFHNPFDKPVRIRRVRVQVPAYEDQAAVDRLYDLKYDICPPLADQACDLDTVDIEWYRLRTPEPKHPGDGAKVADSTITPVQVLMEK